MIGRLRCRLGFHAWHEWRDGRTARRYCERVNCFRAQTYVLGWGASGWEDDDA